ncbi:MAG TPA: hypothetical protein VM537_29660 [Anaerolineae bacterium]|nr:hypothetical protein [Anaerolineae bacterium]
MIDSARLYLTFLERNGNGISEARMYRMYGCSQQSLVRWRKDPEFREKERAIKEQHSLLYSGPGYTTQMDQWIEAYSQHKDRQRACEESGVGWGMIETALQESLPFRTVYTFYSENRLLSEVEDQLVKSAVQGHSRSVDMLLKARHPDYLPTSKSVVEQNVRVTHELVGEQKDWLRQMQGSTAPALEAHVIEEGVDDGTVGNTEESAEDEVELLVS